MCAPVGCRQFCGIKRSCERNRVIPLSGDFAKPFGMVTFALMGKQRALSRIDCGLMLLACLLVGGCQVTPMTPSTSWNVKDFGAAADGKTLDTAAVNRAIDAASAGGGGTVRFSAGKYLCYSIHLKSNITLELDRGATIVAAGTSKHSEYDLPEPNPSNRYQDFGHTHWHNSLIWGEDLHDVSIIGPGLIDGTNGLQSGDGFIRSTTRRSRRPAMEPLDDAATTQPTSEPSREDDPHPERMPPPGMGNKAISLKNCNRVIIRDISVLKGGHFAILATGANNLTIDNVTLDTNRDGMDIDCCSNVRISNCTVNSPSDDGICLKTSYALGWARPTENVTITNCLVAGGWVEGSVIDGTFKLFDPYTRHPGGTGRIKLGTESNGDFKNITISNCVFDHCQGLAIESVDGSVIENLTATNLVMRDLTTSPIFIRLGERLRGPKETTKTGAIRRIILSNIVATTATSRYAGIISGTPNFPIEDVSISNIKLVFPGGGTKRMATSQPAEKEKTYPEPSMFGSLPAWGFFIRHINGLEMRDIGLTCLTADARSPMVIGDVKGLDLEHVTINGGGDVPVILLKNAQDFTAHQVQGVPDTHLDEVQEQRF
jgi:polygalacturonase